MRRHVTHATAMVLAGTCLVLLAPGASTQSAAQAPHRLDRWEVLGPGGGGTTRRPTISPHDPRRVLVACDMTGAYLTEDAGASWRMFNLGTDVSSFAFDPSNPDVIYAGTAALWKSSDRGRTWRMVFPDPARDTRVLMIGDHADYVLRTSDPLYPRAGERMRVQAIAVARDGSVMIAMSGGGVFRGTSDEGFLASSADGSEWRVIRRLPAESVLSMTLAPDGRLAVVTERHVFVQRDGTWIERGGPPGGPMHAASVAFAGGAAIVLASNHAGEPGTPAADGLFASTDGGVTWTDARVGPLKPASSSARTPSFLALALSPRSPSIAYVGFEGVQGGTAPGEHWNGVARTDDGGRSWRLVHREGRAPSPTMDGSWVEERAVQPGPDIWFDAPYDLTVSPTDPDIVYVTDLFRTYRTLDGGAHWAQVHSRRAAEHAWTTTGLDVTTNYGVHVDPHDLRRLFLSNTDIGLFRSQDGGQSWIPSSAGMPQDWRNTTYWVTFDPDDPQLAWGAFSGTHDLPRPKMWRRRDPETFRGGVGISRDGGRTWAPARGLPLGAVTHVLVDPASPAGRRTVYACVFGRGVYKSADGGVTWSARNEGLRWRQPFAWRIVQAPGRRLYLIVSRRSEDGRIGDDQDGALFVSDDGAGTWRAVGLPPGTNGPTGLLVDPADPSRLYLSAWGRFNPDGDTGGGIFLSTDQGTTWRLIFAEGQHVYDVTIDPRNGVLYACGFDQGAWRSADRGVTWQRIRGYAFKWGHRVVPDPATPDKIYVTTFGGGLWHGPAAGDPEATEDTGIVVPARR